eukprot:gb/GECH01003212.1/.p1 GENE.gb/GECH01003212.1/~~gb/GECH01003212.1/.p1  ORF type:complete len:157 (+),score=39.67 gb/GECH01003212.1/:1-471(+)
MPDKKIFPKVSVQEWENAFSKLPGDAMEWRIKLDKSLFHNPSLTFTDVESIPAETLRNAQKEGYSFRWTLGDVKKFKEMKVNSLEPYLIKHHRPVNAPMEIVTGLILMTIGVAGMKTLQWKQMRENAAFWDQYYNQDFEFFNLGLGDEDEDEEDDD